jgi:AI-2 transport protein TqsA
VAAETRTLAAGLRTTASLVVVIAGLKAAASVLLPFLLGLLAAILALPLLRWLETRRLPPALAVFVTGLSGFVVAAALLTLVERSLASFVSAAPRYQQQLDQLANDVIQGLARHGITSAGDAAKHLADPSALMKLLQLTASAVADLLSQATLIFFLTIFILLEQEHITRKFRAAMAGEQGVVSSRYTKIVRQMQRYFGLRTALSFASAVLTATFAALLGVDFAPLWGLLSFAFGFIPSIGSLLSTIPPVLVALLQLGPKRAIVTLVGYVVIQTIIGNIIEPRLMGKSFGLSTLAVFAALLFWGWLWGPIGMFLSVPLLVALKIISDNVPSLRWLSTVLGTPPEAS